MGQTSEHTEAQVPTVHVHVWKPTDQWTYTDADMIVDGDATVTTVYADTGEVQYNIELFVPPEAAGQFHNIEVRVTMPKAAR